MPNLDPREWRWVGRAAVSRTGHDIVCGGCWVRLAYDPARAEFFCPVCHETCVTDLQLRDTVDVKKPVDVPSLRPSVNGKRRIRLR